MITLIQKLVVNLTSARNWSWKLPESESGLCGPSEMGTTGQELGYIHQEVS